MERSDVIEDLGRPTAVDVDSKSGKLYIANEPTFGHPHYPLVAVDLGSFEVLRKFSLTVDSGADEAVRHAAYRVVVSPDGERLYVGYAAPGYLATTVVDANLGVLLGSSNAVVTAASPISPDGGTVAEIWVSGSAVVQSASGKSVREWNGGVVVQEIDSGNVVSRIELSSNKGLQPPWLSIGTPYIHVDGPAQDITAYNRNSGEILAALRISEKLQTKNLFGEASSAS